MSEMWMIGPAPTLHLTARISADAIAECASVGIDKDTTVYLYCFKGARAANTLVALKSADIKDVKLYFGSWNEWSREESLPIEEGLPYAS